jgi:HPt (histidine-containing phosphotransfer) domain-containing protein
MDGPEPPGNRGNVDISAALDQLWIRFLPEIEERSAVLATAASAAAEGRLTATDREAAHAAAHKLAGVLGTFGLTRGTVLARELELAFSGEAAPHRDSGKSLAGAVAELHALIENRKAAQQS